jgi:hypothetical protein
MLSFIIGHTIQKKPISKEHLYIIGINRTKFLEYLRRFLLLTNNSRPIFLQLLNINRRLHQLLPKLNMILDTVLDPILKLHHQIIKLKELVNAHRLLLVVVVVVCDHLVLDASALVVDQQFVDEVVVGLLAFCEVVQSGEFVVEPVFQDVGD